MIMPDCVWIQDEVDDALVFSSDTNPHATEYIRGDLAEKRCLRMQIALLDEVFSRTYDIHDTDFMTWLGSAREKCKTQFKRIEQEE